MEAENIQFNIDRNALLTASDDELLAECKLDFYKSSGKGGQKRNKTASAVRLIHQPTQLAVTDCSERSQHRNRAEALRKLRLNFALKLRVTPAQAPQDLHWSVNNPNFFLMVAQLLDMLVDKELEVALVAEQLEISNSKLLKILNKEPQVFARFNDLRKASMKSVLHA